MLKSDGKTLEAGSWITAETGGQDASLQAQNVVTYHVSENGEALVQEALTQEEAAEGEPEFAQIAISAYETAREFGVVEQTAEEIHSTATAYRYSWLALPASPVLLLDICGSECMECFHMLGKGVCKHQLL